MTVWFILWWWPRMIFLFFRPMETSARTTCLFGAMLGLLIVVLGVLLKKSDICDWNGAIFAGGVTYLLAGILFRIRLGRAYGIFP